MQGRDTIDSCLEHLEGLIRNLVPVDPAELQDLFSALHPENYATSRDRLRGCMENNFQLLMRRDVTPFANTLEVTLKAIDAASRDNIGLTRPKHATLNLTTAPCPPP